MQVYFLLNILGLSYTVVTRVFSSLVQSLVCDFICFNIQGWRKRSVKSRQGAIIKLRDTGETSASVLITHVLFNYSRFFFGIILTVAQLSFLYSLTGKSVGRFLKCKWNLRDIFHFHLANIDYTLTHAWEIKPLNRKTRFPITILFNNFKSLLILSKSFTQ